MSAYSSVRPIVHVHICNLAAQTGASLFFHTHSKPSISSIVPPPPHFKDNLSWTYNKTEHLSPALITASKHFTHAIVEREEVDRLNVTWPGCQLELVAALERVGKPLIVAQFGGGQLDDSTLKNSKAVCTMQHRPSS